MNKFYMIIADNIKRIMKEKDYSEVEVYALFINTLGFNSYDIARFLYPTENQWLIVSPRDLYKIANWFSVDIDELVKETEKEDRLTNEKRMKLIKNANVDIDNLNRALKYKDKKISEVILDRGVNPKIRILNNSRQESKSEI